MDQLHQFDLFVASLQASGLAIDRFIASGRNKQPLGGPGWQDRFVTALVARERIRSGENVALLSGPNNPAIMVVDTDGPMADDWFQHLLQEHGIMGTAFRSSGKGKHYYWKVAPGQVTPKARIQVHEGIDLLGNASNGNAIAPGSIRRPGPKDPEGTEPVLYEWETTTPGGMVPELPQDLLDRLLAAAGRKSRQAVPGKVQPPAEPIFPPARTVASFLKKLAESSPASTMTDGRDNYLIRLAGCVRQRYSASYEQILQALTEENARFSISHPEGPMPMAELERKAKTASEWQASEPDKFTFVEAAQATLDRLEDTERLVFDLQTEEFFQCQAGVYGERSKKEINFAIQDTLDELGLSSMGKSSFLNDAIIRLAKVTAGKPRANTWMDGSRSGHFICLQDCILDVQAYCDAMQILDGEELLDTEFHSQMGITPWRVAHTPDYFTRTKLPFALDEVATCPLWTSHIRQLLPDDATRKEFQKFVGLCLVNDTSYQKAAILLGEGGAGKGTVMRTIEMLVGLQNRSAVSLQDISDKFTVIEMWGKLVNFDADTKADTFDEALFKKVTGEDPIPWQQKYGRAFSAESTARWIISANKMPSITDKSKGVWRRLLLFKVEPPSYTSPDVNLQSKLAREIQGIFNWAIEGLAMLWAEGFKPSQKMQDELDVQRLNSNNVALWVEEKCQTGQGKSYGRQAAFESYTTFVNSNGYKGLNVGNFKAALESLGFKTIRSNTGGTREERIQGLGPLHML